MSLVHLSFTQNLIKAPYIIKLCVVRCVSFFFFFLCFIMARIKKQGLLLVFFFLVLALLVPNAKAWTECKL